MMQTLVTAIQSLCGVSLVLGISLCLYNAARPRSQEAMKRFDYTNANDFETGHRRWARDR